MTIIELLKQAFNATDEQANAFLESMKTNKIFTASEENMDIRYGKLKTQHDGVTKQLGEATTLIEELKKSTKGQEGLQQKITDYEGQVAQLQQELAQTKLDAAIKVELLANKALDVDYLTFKLKEKGELALDENDKIKGWDDKLAGLKTQFPNQFEASSTRKVEEHKLEQGDNRTTYTRSDLLKKPYNERIEIFNKNPEAFREAMKG